MPDETRRLGADGDDRRGQEPGDETVAGAPPDETRAVPPAADETQRFRPAADGTQRFRPAGDETRPLPPAADETRTFPREGDATAGPPAGSVWSGRAEVPPAGLRAPGPATEQWERPPGGDGGGRWWMPIVLGIVGLLLLGGLGYGLWLIAAAEDEPGPAPSATRPAPTARPTTARPTTAAPTREPTEEPEQEVEVPSGLVGGSLEDAQARLDERGLTYRIEYEETESAEPGTVLRTRPDGGSRVQPGSRVTLVVAAAPEEPEQPTAPPSDAGSPSGGTN